MRVTVIGTAYVGLVTGVSLSAIGHNVICVGRNIEKIKNINRGSAPFFEPGLNGLLKKLLKNKKISATDKLAESVKKSDVVIIAVGTPTIEGKIDLTEIKEASKKIGESLKNTNGYKIIVVKSTVVPGTTEGIVMPLIERYSLKKAGEYFGLCMNPEFLREGNALEDALHPDRIVIGQLDKKSGREYAKLYKGYKTPIIFANLKTAELTKYASNALFATLISYSNEIARIAEKSRGIDVTEVWKGVHLDKRLNPILLGKRVNPGILNYILSGCGYGGSCFPKDTKALANFAHEIKEDPELIKSVIDINNNQPLRLLSILKTIIPELKGKKIAVLGLSFKPNTDDLRESAAFPLIKALLSEKAKVVCHDPQAYKDKIPDSLSKLVLTKKAKDALKGANAAIIVTAWEEYKRITPKEIKFLMNDPFIVDGRRILDRNKMEKNGITYRGIGYSG